MTHTQQSIPSPATSNLHDSDEKKAHKHRIPAFVAAGVLLAGILGYAGYWVAAFRYVETTEDAYVEGNVVQVTAQTTGTVTAIHADNTDSVSEGLVLLTLNPIDSKLALRRAQAQLAKTVRQVRGQFASAYQMHANTEQRRAELSRALTDLERRTSLAKTGAISSEDYQHAQEALRSAQAALSASEQQFAGIQALVDETTIEEHPDVLMAAMQVRDAYLAEKRTELRAPVSGMVAKRMVQVGQRVSPGATLMSIVPLDHLWISANFKESQLQNIRIGQRVRLTADVYGSSIEYSGRVLGQDAGTGSAFSLMPAQNATGNWIKVVQRVPVRIALNPDQLKAHPLRIGLSMKVTIDTSDRHGPPLAFEPGSATQSYQTKIFQQEQAGVEELIRLTILSNLAANHAGTKKRRS